MVFCCCWKRLNGFLFNGISLPLYLSLLNFVLSTTHWPHLSDNRRPKTHRKNRLVSKANQQIIQTLSLFLNRSNRKHIEWKSQARFSVVAFSLGRQWMKTKENRNFRPNNGHETIPIEHASGFRYSFSSVSLFQRFFAQSVQWEHGELEWNWTVVDMIEESGDEKYNILIEFWVIRLRCKSVKICLDQAIINDSSRCLSSSYAYTYFRMWTNIFPENCSLAPSIIAQLFIDFRLKKILNRKYFHDVLWVLSILSNLHCTLKIHKSKQKIRHLLD